jgi:hypothetical protein
MNVEVGDWVSGNTSRGELVHGYVESIDVLRGTVGIRVTESDHEAAIGKEVSVFNGSVRKLPVHPADDESALRNLIDLALLTKDEPWFRELSAKLLSLQSGSGRRGRHQTVGAFVRNRLGSGLTN